MMCLCAIKNLLTHWL